MPETLWHIQNCELFGRLSAGQLERLESRSRTRTFPARSPIYLPSERAESVYLLTKGLVTMSHLTPDGKKSILSFVEPGELFGELAIFGEHNREEYVEAMEATTVVMIPIEEMRRLMAEQTDVAISITKMVGLRRHRIERRLKNLLILSNRDRLVHLLLDLAEQFGWHTKDGIRLRIKLSHQEWGNLMGSTRETVTVLLGQLKAERSIDGGRRRIVLTNPGRLARSVDRQPPPEPRPSIRPVLMLMAD